MSRNRYYLFQCDHKHCYQKALMQSAALKPAGWSYDNRGDLCPDHQSYQPEIEAAAKSIHRSIFARFARMLWPFPKRRHLR